MIRNEIRHPWPYFIYTAVADVVITIVTADMAYSLSDATRIE
jgi:hypothetical protein